MPVGVTLDVGVAVAVGATVGLEVGTVVEVAVGVDVEDGVAVSVGDGDGLGVWVGVPLGDGEVVGDGAPPVRANRLASLKPHEPPVSFEPLNAIAYEVLPAATGTM